MAELMDDTDEGMKRDELEGEVEAPAGLYQLQKSRRSQRGNVLGAEAP